jgi:uncharacterized membrane protein
VGIPATEHPPVVASPARPRESSSPRLEWLRAELQRREARGLVLAVVAAALVYTAFSELRFLELYTTTWDFGIYQQAIYSTAHGRPFYESADLETGGFGTFLQVHSAFILFAIVPLYAVFPTPLTLFAVQASVVAFASVPLYALARSADASARRALGLSVLFLASTPIIASTLYDFHIEAFVPLVYLAVAALWNSRHYRWGAVAALVGFLTMEVVPILLFFLAVYFLAERYGERPFRRADSDRSGESVFARIRALVTDPGARPTWLLLIGSVVAYYVLLVLRYHYLADWFGFPAYPSYQSGYVVGGSPSQLGLALSNVAVGFYDKVGYWVLLLVLLGGLPLWAPRTWILSVPWVAFTFLSANTNYTVIGFQYGFIAGAGLFAGAAIGLSRVHMPRRLTPRPERSRSWAVRRLRSVATPTRIAIVSILALNLLLSPLDPMLSNAAPGAAYNILYEAPTSLAGAEALAGLVPAGATVLATNDLFPLVANDLNAYSLFWGPNSALSLPFDLANLPPYVFLSQDRLDSVPPWLSDTVYAPSDYGLRGVAWTSPAGTLFLFERGFAGTTSYWGNEPARSLEFRPSDLSLSASARLLPWGPSPTGAVVESVSGASGQLWSTPFVDLPTGDYVVTFWMQAWLPTGASAPAGSEEVFSASGSSFALPPLLSGGASWSSLNATTFEPVSADLNVTVPILDLQIDGDDNDPLIGLAVGEVTIDTVT